MFYTGFPNRTYLLITTVFNDKCPSCGGINEDDGEREGGRDVGGKGDPDLDSFPGKWGDLGIPSRGRRPHGGQRGEKTPILLPSPPRLSGPEDGGSTDVSLPRLRTRISPPPVPGTRTSTHEARSGPVRFRVASSITAGCPPTDRRAGETGPLNVSVPALSRGEGPSSGLRGRPGPESARDLGPQGALLLICPLFSFSEERGPADLTVPFQVLPPLDGVRTWRTTREWGGQLPVVRRGGKSSGEGIAHVRDFSHPKRALRPHTHHPRRETPDTTGRGTDRRTGGSGRPLRSARDPLRFSNLSYYLSIYLFMCLFIDLPGSAYPLPVTAPRGLEGGCSFLPLDTGTPTPFHESLRPPSRRGLTPSGPTRPHSLPNVIPRPGTSRGVRGRSNPSESPHSRRSLHSRRPRPRPSPTTLGVPDFCHP